MPDDGRVPPHGTAQPALRKHLMDPNAPRPVRDVESELRSLTRVQQ